MRRWLARFVRDTFGTYHLYGWWARLPLYASPLYGWDCRREMYHRPSSRLRCWRCWWRWHGLAVGAFGRAVYVYWGPR